MKTRIWIALLAVYIAWGSTYLAIRFAIETIPPFLMAGTRFLVAGFIVYTWRRLSGDPTPTPRQWRNAAIVGLFLLLGGNGLVSWAEQRVPSGIAALIVAAVPLWVVLVEALRPGGHRPTLQTSAGVLLGLTGIAVLVSPSNQSGSSTALDLIGVTALLAAALLWAVGSVFARGADLPESPLLGTGIEMLAGSAGLFLTGVVTGEVGSLNLPGVSVSSLLGLAYLIVAGSLIGFVAYTWLLRVAPTSMVVTYAYVNPLVAVLLGSLVAQEALTTPVLIAAPVIIAAVALIHFTRSKAPVPTTATARFALPAPSRGED